MRPIFKKLVIKIAIVLIALGIGILIFTGLNNKPPETPSIKPAEISENPKYEIIGKSVEGRKIEAFTYGTGKKHIVFVGGMHGGYEWNSVLLAYRLIDYLNVNPEVVSKNLTVTVIPSVNPDGVYAVVGKEGRFTATDASTDKETLASGRFNAHEVDLNRNFGCKWKPKSTWQTKTVSAGPTPFSEPETAAIKKFVSENNPAAVIFFHSQSNAVYASECKDGVLPETLDIMNAYSQASGYPAVKSFDSYEVTGDAEGWLASVNIPAITVELKTHETVEWDKNLAGVKAVFQYYNQKKD